MKAEGERREEIRLAIEEELDVDRARHAEAELLQHAAAGRRLVLDLSRVPRFDFTGIVVLLDGLARLEDRFGGVSILGLSERISQVFAALGAQAAGWVGVDRLRKELWT
jgi:anti-anti-sigma factor